jgi:hypothetical protein
MNSGIVVHTIAFICDVESSRLVYNSIIGIIIVVLIWMMLYGCQSLCTTSAISGAGTAYPSGSPACIPCVSGVRVALSLTFCAMFCRSLFVFFSFGYCMVCLSSGYCMVCLSFGYCMVCLSFDYCMVFLSFGYCMVCLSLIYGFWLPLWYLQTFTTWSRIYNRYVHILVLDSERLKTLSKIS